MQLSCDDHWCGMQIAVACGWMCILNVLTILALKYLNCEPLTATSLLLQHAKWVYALRVSP